MPDKMWVPNANPDDMRKKKVKVSLRAIDQGTRYDIIGQCKLLARKIEAGDYGDVRHIVVGISAREGTETAVTTLGFGQMTVPEAFYTTYMMQKRLTGNT